MSVKVQCPNPDCDASYSVAPADAATDPVAAVRRLLRRAVERSAAMDSYIARLQRKEQVNGKDQPLEVLSFKFRRQPLSLHTKWIQQSKINRLLKRKKQKTQSISTSKYLPL